MQLPAVEQKRRRAAEKPQARRIVAIVQHRHQPRPDLRLRRANHDARMLDAPIERRQLRRESAPSHLGRTRALGNLAIKQT